MKQAKTKHRIAASICDFLIIFVFVAIITLLKLPMLINMFKHSENVVSTKFIVDLFRWGVISCVFFFAYYAIIPLFFKGQTIGKKLFKIKVVKENGEDINYQTAILREFIGRVFINFASLGVTIVVSMIIMIVRKDKKSLEDILAKTKVIDIYKEEE